MGVPAADPTLIFTYGTLKRGFSNHNLLQEMMTTGDAAFVGAYRTIHSLPLVCGPYRVPFLLNLPGRDHRVSCEIYAVSPAGLAKMDDLEGVSRGHYERLPIEIEMDTAASVEEYYAHRNYAEALWRRNGEEGYNCFTEKVAIGYVRRKDRPHHITFLDQIHLFISDSDSIDDPTPRSITVADGGFEAERHDGFIEDLTKEALRNQLAGNEYLTKETREFVMN